ncbi:MAG: eight-cysteine-cluster domain-containing protein [Pyrobaculum sp.]
MDEFCGFSTGGPCLADEDCVRDGCGGEVCRSVYEDPVVTVCVWKECLDPERYGLVCRCVENHCAWWRA